MSKFKFQPEDFYHSKKDIYGAAARANEILDKHLATLPKVRNGDNTRKWTTDIEPFHRHQAILFNLETIEQSDTAEILLRGFLDKKLVYSDDLYERTKKFLAKDKK